MRALAESPRLNGRRRRFTDINRVLGETPEGSRLSPSRLTRAYDTFADAASTNALKVVLEGGERGVGSMGQVAAGLVVGAV
jgi:hypothetical protein